LSFYRATKQSLSVASKPPPRNFFHALIYLFLLFLPGYIAQAQTSDVGRLMLLAFDTTISPPQELLERYHPSGFLFYVDDIPSSASLRSLTMQLEQTSDYPLIYGIDQEGGPFNAYQVDNATRFPGNMMLAATQNLELARAQGRAIGQELAYLGITMDFAPVADVNSNPDNPIIGIRSFSDKPEVVKEFALAFSQGLESAGLAPVAKHFPGHGNTLSDSHLVLPRVDSSVETLKQVDMLPFRNLLDLPAFMSAHVVYSSLDSKRPATLSPLILTNLLRNEWGYQGVIISDYLDMQALTGHYSPGEAAVLAVEAGVDLLLVSYKPEQQREIYQALQDAVSSGRISEQRLAESIKRIERLTAQFPSHAETVALPDYQKHQELAQTIARAGTSLVLNDGILPLTLTQKIAVISPIIRQYGEEPRVADVLTQGGLNVSPVTFDKNPDEQKISEAVMAAEQSDIVILGLFFWQGTFDQQLTKLYDSLIATGKPIIVIALGNPDILKYLSKTPNAFLATYGFRSSNLGALSEILLGYQMPTTHTPTKITLPE
ncbi:MAG: hypothetical protein KC422_15620, partial [Trueperaceae bacterium]|nr:hypothetical protein [Trueperaceae bacterium]